MKIYISWLVLCVMITPCFLLESPLWTKYQEKDDYVEVDYPIDTSLPFYNYSWSGVSSAGRNYTAFVALLPSDIKTRFSIELPAGGDETSMRLAFLGSGIKYRAVHAIINDCAQVVAIGSAFRFRV